MMSDHGMSVEEITDEVEEIIQAVNEGRPPATIETPRGRIKLEEVCK